MTVMLKDVKPMFPLFRAPYTLTRMKAGLKSPLEMLITRVRSAKTSE